MYHVELKYSLRSEGGRFHRAKAIGAHANITTTSSADWNKTESGHRWLKMMIWNRAALHCESGVKRGTWSTAFNNRFREMRCRVNSWRTE
jgi:hypothetical protein